MVTGAEMQLFRLLIMSLLSNALDEELSEFDGEGGIRSDEEDKLGDSGSLFKLKECGGLSMAENDIMKTYIG